MVKVICALLGFGLVSAFVLGLAHSISTGFAGFKGGLPVWIIALFVLGLAGYDIFDSCFKRKK